MSPFTNCRIVGTNVNPDEYHKHGLTERGDPKFCVSRSTAMDVAACADEWRNGSDEDETSSETQTWGTLVDCLTFTPEQFPKRYAFHPEKYKDSKGVEKDWAWQSKTCQKWRKDKKAAGFEVIEQETHKNALFALARLQRDPIIPQYLDGDHQVMITGEYRDKDTGIVIPVKALIDCLPKKASGLPGKTIVDLKTARDISKFNWEWECFRRQYDVQAAWYLDMFESACPDGDRPDWVHILSRNVNPYQPGRRLMMTDMVELGRITYIKALQYYAQCLKRNKWPGYDDDEEGQKYGGLSPIHCYDSMKARRLMPKFAEAPEAEPEESAVPS